MSTPLSVENVKSYISTYSDFAFETKVLQEVSSLGFDCDHGGTYEDSITKKIRQFDIRAKKCVAPNRYVYAAIECKNFAPSHPLVIHRLARRLKESFHQLLYFPQVEIVSRSSLTAPSRAFPIIVDGPDSIYGEGDFVGKAMDRIHLNRENQVVGKGDADVHERMSQALSSANDLSLFMQTPDEFGESPSFHAVVPFLVVPEDAVWVIDYDDNGQVLGEPKLTDHCSFYADRSMDFFDGHFKRLWTLSHLDIVTTRGLPETLKSYFGANTRSAPKIFPSQEALNFLTKISNE